MDQTPSPLGPRAWLGRLMLVFLAVAGVDTIGDVFPHGISEIAVAIAMLVYGALSWRQSTLSARLALLVIPGALLIVGTLIWAAVFGRTLFSVLLILGSLRAFH